MALMLRVPTPLRCCRMPARMASLSLGWFLHPPEIKRPAESHAASAIRFISEAFLIPMCLSILLGRKSVGNHWQVVSTDACEDLFSRFLVNVASKGLRHCVSALESTLTGIPISVDSKGS